MKQKVRLMKEYLLVTRAIDPATNELATWQLPVTYAATSSEAVDVMCQLEGLGFCKSDGELISIDGSKDVKPIMATLYLN